MRNLARVSGLIVGLGVGVVPHILLIIFAFAISDIGIAVVVLCGGCLTPLVSLLLPGISYSFAYTRFHILKDKRGALGGAVTTVLAQLIAGFFWFIVLVVAQGTIMDTEFGGAPMVSPGRNGLT